MRALQLSKPAAAGTAPLRLVKLPDVEAAPDELVLSVAACAVCRTDLQLVEGNLAARRLPIVPGHQVVGRVEQAGRDVVGWQTGDRAGVGWLASACGACRFCASDRENLCPDARFTGWDRDGGYATRVVVRADFALRLPEAFDDLAAARSCAAASSATGRSWCRESRPAVGSGCSVSGRRPSSRSRWLATGAARSTSARDRAESRSEPLPSAQRAPPPTMCRLLPWTRR